MAGSCCTAPADQGLEGVDRVGALGGEAAGGEQLLLEVDELLAQGLDLPGLAAGGELVGDVSDLGLVEVTGGDESR